MTTSTRRTGGLVALVAALVVAACGTPTSSPSPAPATQSPSPATAAPTEPAASPSEAPPSQSASVCDDTVTGNPDPSADPNDPNGPTYEEIEAQVEELRGLAAETPVERGVFDQPGLCVYLRQGFTEDNPEDLVRATELLYKELGLMPQDESLEDLYLELLTSQVAGLYDDDTKKMYVVSKDGGIGPTEEITYAHEYTHALQDQRFVLRDVVGEATDQSDRTMARVTVVEGDATLLMSLWAQRFLTPAELGEVAGSVDPASQAILDRMPSILREPLEFPYIQGLQLALGAFTNGGFAAVDDLYANPPDTTEQVMHADKLQAREPAVPVTFPADLAARLGEGWTVTAEDTFGEMLLGVVLRDAEGATATGDAAAGWGGDRVALIEGPGGEVAVVLDTAWDTEADAAEFEAALAPTVAELSAMGRSPSVLRPAADRVVLVSATSADTMARVANVLGLAE